MSLYVFIPRLAAKMLIAVQTPAGDIPMRSISLASDGSCLVAGNNKVLLVIHSFSSPAMLNHPHTSVPAGEVLRLED